MRKKLYTKAKNKVLKKALDEFANYFIGDFYISCDDCPVFKGGYGCSGSRRRNYTIADCKAKIMEHMLKKARETKCIV